MRVMISACRNKAVSYGLMPVAHLNLRPPAAVNDNHALFSPPRTCHAFGGKRSAYGRAEFIRAVLAIVTGLITLPLLQGLAAPITAASAERPTVLRSSPAAPDLLQPQRNG